MLQFEYINLVDLKNLLVKDLSGRKFVMKGIILAGGRGTRLYPLTKVVSKQLLPVYDKPLIYYPLSTLMLAGIKEILIISTPEDTPRFKQLLGDGSQLGIKLEYKIQYEIRGVAHAFILGEDFIGKDSVALILGDNIFYGNGLSILFQKAVNQENGAVIFGYHVTEPENFGILEFDENNDVQSITEKPTNPKSNYAVTGLYFYDNHVIDIAKSVIPSSRGELEITDINNTYLHSGKLSVEILEKDYAWFDVGTHQSLLEAGVFIETTETQQNLKIACIEEVAYKMNYIDKAQLFKLAKRIDNNDYCNYILNMTEDKL